MWEGALGRGMLRWARWMLRRVGQDVVGDVNGDLGHAPGVA